MPLTGTVIYSVCCMVLEICSVSGMFGRGKCVSIPSFAPAVDRRAGLASAKIVDVRVVPPAYVYVRVRPVDRAIYIPNCRKATDGAKMLCVLSTRLQVRRDGNWQYAPFRHLFGVLGGESLESADGDMVAVGQDAALVYLFRRRYFEVDAGEDLRLVISTWRDRAAMIAGREPDEIITPSFKCPEMKLSD